MALRPLADPPADSPAGDSRGGSPAAPLRIHAATRYLWPAGIIWTALIVAAMLATHEGQLDNVTLRDFAVFIVLWGGGVLALVAGFIAARAHNIRQVQSLAELRASEAGYRRLFAQSPSAMFLCDVTTAQILAANDAAQQQYGYSRDEFLKLSLGDLLPAAEIEPLERALPKARPEFAFSGVSRHRRKHGGQISVEVRSQAMPWNGRAACCVVVIDITERERAEERLRTVNARLQTLVANLRVGVLVEAADRRVAVANDAFCRMFGIQPSPSHLEGGDGTEAARKAAALFADPVQFVSRIRELIRQREPFVSESLSLADGREFERDYVPIVIEGTGQGHLWVYRDITLRHRMEQTLEKRLSAITSPVEIAGGIDFDELFTRADIQKLQDQFARAAGVASIITRPDGTPITRPSNFTHLCQDIIRKTEKGCGQCIKSDAALGVCNPDGPTIQQCLSGGLWDAGASIVVGGRHIANWLIGQVRNEAQDEERMREYARDIGADEEAFMRAFRQVPCMSREQFEDVAQTLFTFSQQLSAIAYQNVQQARFITELNRVEQALRSSEERFRSTIEHAGAGYFRINRERTFEFVNRAWLELHGLASADEIVGRHFRTAQVEADRAAVEQLVSDGFAGHNLSAGEFTRKLSDGSVGYHTFSLYPVRHDGEVVALEGFLIDTTSLHRVRADYRMLFDTMLDGFALHEIICDAAGQPVDYRFLAVNPAFERQTGLKATELLGRTVLEVLPQTEAKWIQTFGRVALTGEAVIFDSYSAVLKRHFEVSSFCPSPRRFACVVADITDRKRADSALTSSERRFRSLVEDVPNIAVQGYDRQRRVIFWNAASVALYGYTREEALGRQLEDLIIPAEMREGVIAAVEGFVTRDEPIPAGELELRRKDGRPVSVYSSHVMLERADGEREMHCIDIDLGARKAAEQALAAAHDFHLRMLSQAPALIWRADTNGNCNWFNQTWLVFTGRTLEQEAGDGWTQGVHPDDLARIFAIYQTAFQARESFEMEYRLRRHDGEFRWISDNGIPFNSASGEFGGFIGYCYDLTERRRANEQIREQAALLDVTEDAILVTALDRTVTYWNRGAERMYEIPASEAQGCKLDALVYREIPPEFQRGWERLLDRGEWAGDRQQMARSGRLIDVRIRSKLVRNVAGQPTSVLVVITDVTESKRMEAQFLRAQRLESLGALASGVAHDLNNVLTPILMSVELLRPLAHEQQDHDMLQLLSDSARRGSDIVQQLLLFARGSDSPRSLLNAGGIIKDVGRMMRQTFPKNIVLSVQAPADLRLIQADRTQLHQVVLNLCVNARDAMPQGGRLTVLAENVVVDEAFAQRHAPSRSGAYVRIQVKDTGAGIAAEHLEKIFDPFFTTKPVGQGTGLGLATVMGIVRSHEGIVDVKSQPGNGSTFEIYLPAVTLGSEDEPDHPDNRDQAGRQELVLVVEDEESIRSLLQRALTANGYRVLVASDGAEALGVYARNATTIKLVVSDMMMPVMGGVQTVNALRRLNPHLPVVAISGLPAQRAELEKSAGPRIRFLSKPFATDHALRLVREVLDEAETAARNPPPA